MDNDTTGGYSAVAEPALPEASLVGPVQGPDTQSLVGVSEPAPEELQKIHEALLAKKELGLYADKDLLIAAGGRKVVVDSGNPNIGIDAETSALIVRHPSGNWLSQSDGEFEKTLSQAVNSPAAESGGVTVAKDEDKKPQDPQEKTGERQQLIREIETMVAIDQGSGHAHERLDEIALQKINQGASSTMALKDMKAIVATIDGFAVADAADLNIERLTPTALHGPGVEARMQEVRARKEQENAAFVAANKRREEKDKKG